MLRNVVNDDGHVCAQCETFILTIVSNWVFRFFFCQLLLKRIVPMSVQLFTFV